MRIAVTGASGFLGANLMFRLRERGHQNVLAVDHRLDDAQLARALRDVDFVFHLAGVNRPRDPTEFGTGNALFAERLTAMMKALPHAPRVAYSSSIQAAGATPYGVSKRAAEDALKAYEAATGAAVYIYRLPNVFGKWSRPNFNSVVATFCYNIARGLPIDVHDRHAPLELVYVDDVVEAMSNLVDQPDLAGAFLDVRPVYGTTVGELADTIGRFRDSRSSLVMPGVGEGLVRALYSTYVSFLPTEAFAYEVPRHEDPRGSFVEVLKTGSCGQFSYFTTHPGVTRGQHYHHSKTEKFLVISGHARFRFRHVQSGETHELRTSGARPVIVETVPGWAHDITNVGDEEMVVMLWANEVFDRRRPDTFACPL